MSAQQMPLNAPDGTQLTETQAIAWILAKTTGLLSLKNRPRSPTAVDDLYGHILSMRAEGLITQAILTQLAAQSGVDVQSVRNAVLGSLNG